MPILTMNPISREFSLIYGTVSSGKTTFLVNIISDILNAHFGIGESVNIKVVTNYTKSFIDKLIKCHDKEIIQVDSTMLKISQGKKDSFITFECPMEFEKRLKPIADLTKSGPSFTFNLIDSTHVVKIDYLFLDDLEWLIHGGPKIILSKLESMKKYLIERNIGTYITWRILPNIRLNPEKKYDITFYTKDESNYFDIFDCVWKIENPGPVDIGPSELSASYQLFNVHTLKNQKEINEGIQKYRIKITDVGRPVCNFRMIFGDSND